MRRLLVVIGAIVVMAVVGCEPSIGPTFRTSFPARDGSAEGTLGLAELQVVLHDYTNLVAAVSVVEPAIGRNDSLGQVEQVANDSSAIRIDWLAGVCESRVTILFVDTGDRYGISMKSHPTLPGMLGCPALGVSRSLVVRFKQPVASSSISANYPLDG
jgi:hypothetical protein